MATEADSAERATGAAHATASPPDTGRRPECAARHRTPDDARPAGRPPVGAGPTPFRGGLLLLVGVVLAFLDLRAALGGVAPVLGEISDSFGMTATVASLVTTLPVLATGLASARAVAGAEARHGGGARRVARAPRRGVALRRGAGDGGALRRVRARRGEHRPAQRADAGADQARVPRPRGRHDRRLPTRMILGATVSAALAVPLGRLLGGWRGSLLSWAFLAAVAALLRPVRVAVARRGRRGGGRRARAGGVSGGSRRTGAAPLPAAPSCGVVASRPVRAESRGRHRRPGATGARSGAVGSSGQVTLFMGFQSMMVCLAMAWMPTILTDDGTSGRTAGLVFPSPR